MNPLQKKRLTYLTLMLIIIGIAIGLSLFALKNTINLFYTPTELINEIDTHGISATTSFRLGGIVEKGSILHDTSQLRVTFLVKDIHHVIKVEYKGILPDLFKENQFVIIQGKLEDGNIIQANEVLAKHDERYIPATFKKDFS